MVFSALDVARSRRIDRLVSRLKSSDQAARGAAKTALYNLKDEEDIRRLIKHLGDENEDVRDEVVSILGRIGAPAVKPLADELIKQERFFFSLWFRLSSRVPIAPVREWLIGGGEPSMGECIRAFAAIGEPAADTLVGMAQGNSRLLYIAAVKSLARVPAPRAFDLLVKEVKNRGGGSRDAAWGLRTLKMASIRKSKTGDFAPEGAGAWREYEAKDEQAIEPLLALTKGVHPYTRDAAYSALACYTDDPRVFAAIMGTVQDGSIDPTTKVFIVQAVGQGYSPRLIEILFAALRDPNGGVRSMAVHALVYLRDDGKLPLLAAALGDANPNVRDGAMSFFKNARNLQKARALADAYDASNDVGKANIVKALEYMRDVSLDVPDQPKEVTQIDAEIQKSAREALETIDASKAPLQRGVPK